MAGADEGFGCVRAGEAGEEKEIRKSLDCSLGGWSIIMVKGGELHVDEGNL